MSKATWQPATINVTKVHGRKYNSNNNTGNNNNDSKSNNKNKSSSRQIQFVRFKVFTTKGFSPLAEHERKGIK